jgi:uncharacterized protein (DUF58 family)
MLLPTRRLLALLGAGVPIFLASAWVDGMQAVGLGYLVVLATSAAADALAIGRRTRISVERKVHDNLFVGTKGKAEVRVVNAGREKLRVELAEEFSEGLALSEERLSLEIEAGATQQIAYELTGKSRGEHELKGVDVRVQPSWGLWTRQFRASQSQKVTVLPSVRQVSEQKLLTGRRSAYDQGINLLRDMGLGTEFESLRQYCVGDDLGKIDWKASARRNELIVKNYQVEREQCVVVAIDMGRSSASEFAGKSRLDYYVEAAILLAYVVLKQGDSFGLIAFGSKVEQYLPPVKGLKALSTVIESMAKLQPELRESDYAGAMQYLSRRHRKRSLVVVMSEVIDPQASGELIAYMIQMAKRHMPLLVSIRDKELDKLAEGEARTIDEVYGKAIAIDQRRMRERAIGQARMRGVGIVDSAASEIATGLVRKYVEIKKRRSL